MRGKLGLRAIYFLALSAVSLAAMAVFVVFDVETQRRDTEASMVEEARTFAREMDAVWKFMETSQDTINYTSDGTYEFKGLHCAIVGKSIGAIFSANNDYSIRYTNLNPRRVHDRPDEFETAALNAFHEDRSVTEYYDTVVEDDVPQFRYVRALEVDESCLECHGEPVGEIDITGHDKEGWTIGSVGGAISISIPAERASSSLLNNVLRDVAFFAFLILAIGAVVYVVTARFVLRPVGLIKMASSVEAGGYPRQVASSSRAREMAQLISQFNAMARELSALYAGLEEKVADRTRDLQQVNLALERQRDQLEALGQRLAEESQFKTDMLSMVSHELRTPLTAILATTHLSLGSCGEGSESWHAWDEVRKSSLVLLDMVNNLLDIARLDAGRESLACEPIDLGDLVAAAQEDAWPLAENAHLVFSAQVAADVPLVYGDYDKTHRALENLVTNAIKFTPDGGSVRMSASVEAETGDVLVQVEDTGIGVAPEDQDRIFDRFVQVDCASTRRFKGSGLGLALVREYALLQGFTVEVSSHSGVGSTFTLRVPACLAVALDEEDGESRPGQEVG